jgi:hypothetical protein
MRRVLTKDLNTALNRAEVHPETQGTRIEYDGHSIGLSAEYLESTDYTEYKAYDVSDKEVTLTDDQHTIVHKFVKGLYETRIEKQLELRNQF